MVVFLLLGLFGLLALGALIAVFAILRQPAPDGAREAPRPAPAVTATTAPSAASKGAATASGPIPPIPAFPSPAHRLKPGVYMFGQLWRWDGVRWNAEIGDDCEPVMAIFDTPMLGTCAVTWDSVHRRTSPGGPWAREYRSPNGRPRLSSGWGHPIHGLFAGGDRGTVLHSKGDCQWSRLELPEALRTVVSAIWGDDDALYLGLADGRIAKSLWVSRGEWQTAQAVTRDYVFDGVSTPRGQYAVSQSGDVLFLARDGAPDAWRSDKKLKSAAKGLWADTAGRVWISGADGVFRSDAPGVWVQEPSSPQVPIDAIGSNGAVTWGGGSRSILQRRDAAGNWSSSAPGKSGSIVSLWVGPGQELLVGTEFMIEVSEGGRGVENEVVASASVAS